MICNGLLSPMPDQSIPGLATLESILRLLYAYKDGVMGPHSCEMP